MKNMKFIPINENKIAALLNSEKDIIKIEVNNMDTEDNKQDILKQLEILRQQK